MSMNGGKEHRAPSQSPIDELSSQIREVRSRYGSYIPWIDTEGTLTSRAQAFRDTIPDLIKDPAELLLALHSLPLYISEHDIEVLFPHIEALTGINRQHVPELNPASTKEIELLRNQGVFGYVVLTPSDYLDVNSYCANAAVVKTLDNIIGCLTVAHAMGSQGRKIEGINYLVPRINGEDVMAERFATLAAPHLSRFNPTTGDAPHRFIPDLAFSPLVTGVGSAVSVARNLPPIGGVVAIAGGHFPEMDVHYEFAIGAYVIGYLKSGRGVLYLPKGVAYPVGKGVSGIAVLHEGIAGSIHGELKGEPGITSGTVLLFEPVARLHSNEFPSIPEQIHVPKGIHQWSFNRYRPGVL